MIKYVRSVKNFIILFIIIQIFYYSSTFILFSYDMDNLLYL